MREKAFHPKTELAEIASSPREERGERLHKFKAEYRTQQEGIASMQEVLIQTIRENPDVGKKVLASIAKDHTERYGIPKQWTINTESLIGRYVENHRIVRFWRDHYPDDSVLFDVLFNRPPEGEVKITEFPAMLGVSCKKRVDYEYILKTFSPEILSADAILLGQCAIPGLDRMVAVDFQSVFIADQKKRESSLRHEEQHAVNAIFMDEFPILPDLIDMTKRVTGLANIAKEYMKPAFRTAEERVKDELLAWFVSDGATVTTYRILTESPDYNFVQGFMRASESVMNISDPKEAKEIMNMTQKRIKKYQEDIWNGIEAIRSLSKEGWSEDKITAYLVRFPLTQWPKIVKRLEH